jgi:hypothetical protein
MVLIAIYLLLFINKIAVPKIDILHYHYSQVNMKIYHAQFQVKYGLCTHR